MTEWLGEKDPYFNEQFYVENYYEYIKNIEIFHKKYNINISL